MGSHVGGYTGFSVDVTKAVKAGNNEMAVRVNNIWKPDVAPRAGEHVFSGDLSQCKARAEIEDLY